MIIRKYTNADLDAIARLFYQTIHRVNCAHYSQKQLFAWAPDEQCFKTHAEDLLRLKTLVAETDGKIVGFGAIDDTGYLDLLYVHKDYQRQGVATALCDNLETGFTALTTHASITAKPFFEKRGYKAIKEREVERMGVILNNFLMEKHIK